MSQDEIGALQAQEDLLQQDIADYEVAKGIEEDAAREAFERENYADKNDEQNINGTAKSDVIAPKKQEVILNCQNTKKRFCLSLSFSSLKILICSLREEVSGASCLKEVISSISFLFDSIS